MSRTQENKRAGTQSVSRVDGIKVNDKRSGRSGQGVHWSHASHPLGHHGLTSMPVAETPVDLMGLGMSSQPLWYDQTIRNIT